LAQLFEPSLHTAEKEKDIYDTLIKNVQISVDKSIKNYEVNLYGSHATNLCLPWSDLDVVLIKKNNVENTPNLIQDNNNNLMLLSKLYEYIRGEPWVKDCKLISKAAVPIIKLVTIEKYNNMSIDISIQDDKHFGLKCVELVKQFINEFKSLKPLVLAIKNILKNKSNYLNDKVPKIKDEIHKEPKKEVMNFESSLNAQTKTNKLKDVHIKTTNDEIEKKEKKERNLETKNDKENIIEKPIEEMKRNIEINNIIVQEKKKG